jgi:hypothetical protein
LIKFTLKEYGQVISGSIGKLKNPYSATDSFILTEIRYYQGCSSRTPTDSTSKSMGSGFQIQLSAGTIPTVDFSTTSKIVGDQSSSNVASFTFTPGTQLPSTGGIIDITAPEWYSSLRRPMFAFDSVNFECTSDRFVSILS